MKKSWAILTVVLAALALLAVITAQAGSLHRPPVAQSSAGSQAALDTTFTYQGQLKSAGEPVSGDCQMAFRLYDDGVAGSQVGNAISATVPLSEGLFTASLDFGSDAFGGDARWLGIQVNCPGDSGYADLGRQALTAVPYALYAARSGGPENVLTVAKSGGDYSSVQAAIDSINDASADNAYLVWVAPGVYSETVSMRPHVHVQGAGQGATVITSTVDSGGFLPARATLVLTHHVSLRDLTLGNTGDQDYNMALLATDGTTQTLVADVTALARGKGSGNNYGIYLYGHSTGVTLLDVSALAENGAYNTGLRNYYGAIATLRGGFFTGRGGNSGHGIGNGSDGSTLDAEGVTALAEGGTDTNYGITNGAQATAILRGGSFTARGGTNTYGIYNYNSSTTLTAHHVTALAEGGGSNYGLRNSDHGMVTLHGGSFTGRSGANAHGIYNYSEATLEANQVTALGEDGISNYGLLNDDGSTATLRDGSFIGRGGTSARGIYTLNTGTYLQVERITARGEGAATTNRGLESSIEAAADVTESVIEGAGNSVVTSGGGGPVALSNCRLIGGAATGNVSCTAVSRGATFNASGCP